MKLFNLFFSTLALFLLCACNDKDDDLNPLEKKVEKDLTIQNGQRVYSDETGAKYHTMVFDLNHLSHVYKMNRLFRTLYHGL